MQLSFKIPKVLSTLPKVRPPYYFSYFIYFILLLFHIIIFHISHYFKNIYILFQIINQASLVAQMVKNLPAMWETWVRSLG